MIVVDAESAESYLWNSGHLSLLGHLGQRPLIRVRELAGGISNIVLLVEFPQGQLRPFVLKQAREQLRVADPWFCSVERIWREVQVLRACEQLLCMPSDQSDDLQPDFGETASVPFEFALPRVLFEDRENFLFAMDAAPAHDVWKAVLLGGHCDPRVAAACGTLMGMIHARSWNNRQLASELCDTRFFYDLRVDPYYRQIARVHPQLANVIDRLCDSLEANRIALVHGDFSPKNLLVYDHHLMLVDCEVGHFGDPAFDLGFFLAHLFLKAVRARPLEGSLFQLVENFWHCYRAQVLGHRATSEYDFLERRAVHNFLGCTLARIDGKSKVDYLTERHRIVVREFCMQNIVDPPSTWNDVQQQIARWWTTW